MTEKLDSTAVPRLQVHNASKTFAARTVLSAANLTVMPGEIHGIVGQNGSGKSTLAKVITGVYQPDSGTDISVDGETLPVPVRLADLRTAGVGIVHQDLGLIETGTVVENVRIAAIKGVGPFRRIHWDREVAAASDALERLGFKRSLRDRVSELSPADRARVAIARAIQGHRPGHGVLIFDESTRALPAEALEDFYATIDTLRADGTAVVTIGHRLGEILEHCDRVSVLRDGRVVAEGLPTAGVSEGQLASRMLGHELLHLEFEARQRSEVGENVRVSGLVGGALKVPLDLEVGPGEIVGLTGLPGSGFEDVPYLVGGAQPGGGSVSLGERTFDLSACGLRKLISAGIVIVPEDRPVEGLGLTHTVMENISLPWLAERSSPWLLGRDWQLQEATTVMDRLGVVPRDPNHLVGKLSGGNQQKVLLGKWLAGGARLLLLHEPTQAVDVKARQDLLRAIHATAEQGTSVLLASTEVEDLVTVCDRVLIFRDGVQSHQMTATITADELIESTYSTDSGPTATTVPGRTREGDEQ